MDSSFVRRHGRRPSASGLPSVAGAAGPGAFAFALAAALLSAALVPRPAAGQGIEDEIRQLGTDNGRLYAQPVTSGLGAGLNSGWFHSARALGPLHVEVGIRGMGAIVPAEDERYQPILPSEVTIEALGGRSFQNPYGTGEGLSTPTAVGAGAGIVVRPQGEFRQALLDAGENPDRFALRFPRGFDVPAVPVATFQLNVGVVPGVEVSGRYVPSVELDEDLGRMESYGGGLKLSVTDWIPDPVPLDVAVAGGVQTFDAGDYLSADSRHLSVLVSRELSVLTLYAAGGLEASDARVDYTVENPNLVGGETTVSFEDEGENTSRLTAGFALDLLFLQVNADYTVSHYEVVSAGVALQF